MKNTIVLNEVFMSIFMVTFETCILNGNLLNNPIIVIY